MGLRNGVTEQPVMDGSARGGSPSTRLTAFVRGSHSELSLRTAYRMNTILIEMCIGRGGAAP